MEDGEVVASYHYTGNAAKCDWWNDTWCIKIKGKSGVITYGELEMPEYNRGLPSVGTFVKAGDFIGVVGQVLKDGKKRGDIRNHNVCMLHVELRTENCHIDGWKLDEDRDKRLLDPTPYLKLIF
jgi:murein DD-endopeptidase MepM/ murein hydrolase activator NlpD